ncbi:MAG: hypothetical protein QNI89_12295, partial [Desulfobacterales bacterium]|nr:hypothetical protein [Desulfobacterales bacterium]
ASGIPTGGIFRSQAAFSLFVGPRRSIIYACGRQIAAAWPETEIYPLSTASGLHNVGHLLISAGVRAQDRSSI